MTKNPYINRLMGAMPNDDPNDVVGIGLAAEPRDNWLFVPGDLFGVIIGVAAIYDLHYLGTIHYFREPGARRGAVREPARRA